MINTTITNSKSRRALISMIKATINTKSYVICPALNRRKVFIGKYLEVNKGARASLQKFQAFHAGLEVIKNASSYTKTSKLRHSYELKSLLADGNEVIVHIAEKEFQNKNHRLEYLSGISIQPCGMHTLRWSHSLRGLQTN